ncbi:hypothetical protein B0O99DRAFT_695072 [Bisporella sp. PMI_857]|nr:hypothetical protein B0O99DRAFT_695072 [Bisporella sp. PMI_857]
MCREDQLQTEVEKKLGRAVTIGPEQSGDGSIKDGEAYGYWFSAVRIMASDQGEGSLRVTGGNKAVAGATVGPGMGDLSWSKLSLVRSVRLQAIIQYSLCTIGRIKIQKRDQFSKHLLRDLNQRRPCVLDRQYNPEKASPASDGNTINLSLAGAAGRCAGKM